jgi:hypothetical protein
VDPDPDPVYSLLRAKGFSCSLVVLYGGLGISKLQFLTEKINIKFFNFYMFFVTKTLDPHPDWFSALNS